MDSGSEGDDTRKKLSFQKTLNALFFKCFVITKGSLGFLYLLAVALVYVCLLMLPKLHEVEIIEIDSFNNKLNLKEDELSKTCGRVMVKCGPNNSTLASKVCYKLLKDHDYMTLYAPKFNTSGGCVFDVNFTEDSTTDFKYNLKIKKQKEQVNKTLRHNSVAPFSSPLPHAPGTSVTSRIFSGGNTKYKTGYLKVTLRLEEVIFVQLLDDAIFASLNASLGPPAREQVSIEKMSLKQFHSGLMALQETLLLFSIFALLRLLCLTFLTYISVGIFREKETRLKATIVAKGISLWLYWGMWFVLHLTLFLMIAILPCVTVRNICLELTSILLVVFIMGLTCVSCILLVYLLVALMSKRMHVILILWMLSISSLLPEAILFLSYQNISLWHNFVLLILNPMFLFDAFVFSSHVHEHYYKTGSSIADLYSYNELTGANFPQVLTLWFILPVVYVILVSMLDTWSFYFPGCTCCQSKGSKAHYGVMQSEQSEGDVQQDKIGLEVIKLRKTFRSIGQVTHAVNSVSFRVKKNEITALLGHNGAGKTTVISMVTGTMKSDSGKIIVDGESMTGNFRKLRGKVSVCPQSDVLFDFLTLTEHLLVYAKMNGYSHKAAVAVASRYIVKLEMGYGKRIRASKLSAGMKRRLSLALAFVSVNDVVLLDEPTTGIDPQGSLIMWSFIKEELPGRTVIVTTHDMKEVDANANFAIILNEGKVVTSGYVDSLREEFGGSHSLVVKMSSDEKIDEITALVLEQVPSSNLTEQFRNKGIYNLPDSKTSRVSNLLKQLEEMKPTLNILSLELRESSIEEVFIQSRYKGAGSNVTKEERSRILKSDLRSLLERPESSRLVAVLARIICPTVMVLLVSLRRPLPSLTKILLPGLSILVAYIQSRLLTWMAEINVEPIVLLETCNNSLCQEFQRFGGRYAEIRSMSGAEHFLRDIDPFQGRHIGCVVIKETSRNNYDVEIRYSLQYTMLHAEMARWVRLSAARITYRRNIQLTSRVRSDSSVKFLDLSNNSVLCRFIQMGLVLRTFLSCVIPMNQIESGCKHLQVLAGVPVILYWSALAAVEGLSLALSAIFTYGMFALYFSLHYPKEFLELLVKLFVFVGWGLMGYVFLVTSLPFSKSTKVGMILGMLIIFSVSQIEVDWPVITDVFAFISSINPLSDFFHCLCNGLSLANSLESCEKLHCARNSSAICCPGCVGRHCRNQGYLLEPDSEICGDKLRHVKLMALMVFLALFVLDMQLIGRIVHIVVSTVRAELIVKKNTNPEVELERERVRKQLSKSVTDGVLLSNATKMYLWRCVLPFKAVSRLTFGVQKNECFGLIGVNAGGKTTTFRMVTGQTFPTFGSVYLKGYNCTYCREMAGRMGYCPQGNALITQFTCYETLLYFALLRGVPLRKVQSMIQIYLQVLDLQQLIWKTCGNYSGGNKRKLQTGISMIGEYNLLLLDEPTAGVDPMTRKNIWEVLEVLKYSGMTILLTSHSLKEIEALCDRVGVMYRGLLLYIGDQQNFRNSHCPGHVVELQLIENTEENIDIVKTYFDDKHPEGFFSRQEANIKVTIHSEVQISTLFDEVNDLKSNNNFIKRFSIRPTDLEDTFISKVTK